MSEIRDISKVIKEIRSDSGLTQKEFGEKIGVSEATVSMYESGQRSPKMKTIEKAAEIFGYKTKDLIFASPRKVRTHHNPILVYGRICAGNGITAYEDILDEIANPFPRLKGDLIALQVAGDSMNNVVPNGAYAIIKRQEEAENGQIVAVIIDGEDAVLKRFQRAGDDVVILRADSTEEYEPRVFVDEDINRLKIIGRYVGAVIPGED